MKRCLRPLCVKGNSSMIKIMVFLVAIKSSMQMQAFSDRECISMFI